MKPSSEQTNIALNFRFLLTNRFLRDRSTVRHSDSLFSRYLRSYGELILSTASSATCESILEVADDAIGETNFADAFGGARVWPLFTRMKGRRSPQK